MWGQQELGIRLFEHMAKQKPKDFNSQVMLLKAYVGNNLFQKINAQANLIANSFKEVKFAFHSIEALYQMSTLPSPTPGLMKVGQFLFSKSIKEVQTPVPWPLVCLQIKIYRAQGLF